MKYCRGWGCEGEVQGESAGVEGALMEFCNKPKMSAIRPTGFPSLWGRDAGSRVFFLAYPVS